MNSASKLESKSLALIIFLVLSAVLLAVSITIMPLWITGILLCPVIITLLLVWPSSSRPQGSALITLLYFYIMIFCTWPQYSSYKIPGLPAIEPYRLIYTSLIIIWAVLLFVNKNARNLFVERIRFAWFPIVCLLMVYGLHFFVALFSENPFWSFFLAFRELITGTLIFAVALVAIKDVHDLRRLFLFITIGAGVVSILAITESVLKHNLFSSWMPLSSAYAEWATSSRERDGIYRVQAIFDNPLLLVDFLILVWPIALYVANESGGLLKKLFGLIVTILIPIALLRTGSRAAILIMAIEVVIFLVLWIWRASTTKKSGGLPYLVAGALILSTLFVPIVLKEFSTLVSGRSVEEASSSYSRIVMVTRAIDDLSKGNLFGHGFGKSASVIGIKTGAPGRWIYVLDNYFITLTLDSGLLALACYCAFWFWLLHKGLVAALTLPDEFGRIASVTFLATFGFILVKTISSQSQVFPLFFIVAASLVVLLHTNSKELTR